MLDKVPVFLESIKFSHTLFALPFALLSAALASVRDGGWRLLDLVGILLCMVFARTAAMGFNRWIDRDVDALNPRTAGRALPSGQLTPLAVMAFVLISSVGFIASTGIFILSHDNWLPLILSAPVLAWLLGYSLAKRFTSLAHVWLGMALALSPIAAWIAIRGQVEWPPVLLGLAVAFWVTGFDIIYACQDIEVDRQLGLHSIPARLGRVGAMLVARFCHAAMLVILALLAWTTPELRLFFPIGVGAVTILLIYEHWLVRDRDLARINLAFLYVNGVISTGLLAMTLADLYGG